MKNRMIYQLSPFFGGIVFALGLGISGMLEPKKILAFLDLFGNWNPALLFVMLGAIGVHMLLFRLIMRRSSPLFDSKFHLPSRKDIDRRLVIGAILFGIGWGIAGLCPGPGLVSLVTGHSYVLTFVLALNVGFILARVFWVEIQKR